MAKSKWKAGVDLTEGEGSRFPVVSVEQIGEMFRVTLKCGHWYFVGDHQYVPDIGDVRVCPDCRYHRSSTVLKEDQNVESGWAWRPRGA